MDLVKPEPLMVGGKAIYSLSSYDPVDVEVVVPYTSDDEVELALSSMLESEGGSQVNLGDPSWIAKHFDGLRSPDEVRRVLRARLREMNEGFAESQKRDICMAALAERLCQQVPQEQVAQARQGVEAGYRQRAKASGMTLDQFIERGGASRAEFDAMLDAQAAQTAQIDAALDAYAREKKLSVAESEVPELLGIDPKQAKALVAQAKATGRYDMLKDAALRTKAAEAVVAECRCTYKHETEAEAAKRLEMLRNLMAQG